MQEEHPLSARVQRLHPAVRWVWLASAGIAFAAALVIGLFVEWSVRRELGGLPGPPGVWALLGAALLGAWAAGFAWLRYQAWGYLLRDEDLVIQSGVLFKLRRCIPRSRVQHVDITSGPLDRTFGLVQVQLYTAGGIGAVASIPGLAPEAAEQLRSALVRSSSDGV